MNKFLRYVFHQSLIALTLIIGIIVCSFLIFNVLPGDAARVRLGPYASAENVEKLRLEMGLGDPLYVQLINYGKKTIRMDFGVSWTNNRDVLTQVLEKMGTTFKIGLLSTIISLFISYLLNLICFLQPRLNWLLMLTKIGIVAPSFFVGIFVSIFFGIWINLFSLGEENMSIYLLIATTASLYPLALMTAVLRENVTAANQSAYGKAAHALGFSKLNVFNRTIIPSVAAPWLAVSINQLSVLLMAGLILEVIFSMDGLGAMLMNAIDRKDLPILQVILLLNGFLFIIINLVSESLYVFIDPRIIDNSMRNIHGKFNQI